MIKCKFWWQGEKELEDHYLGGIIEHDRQHSEIVLLDKSNVDAIIPKRYNDKLKEIKNDKTRVAHTSDILAYFCPSYFQEDCFFLDYDIITLKSIEKFVYTTEKAHFFRNTTRRKATMCNALLIPKFRIKDWEAWICKELDSLPSWHNWGDTCGTFIDLNEFGKCLVHDRDVLFPINVTTASDYFSGNRTLEELVSKLTPDTMGVHLWHGMYYKYGSGGKDAEKRLVELIDCLMKIDKER